MTIGAVNRFGLVTSNDRIETSDIGMSFLFMVLRFGLARKRTMQTMQKQLVFHKLTPISEHLINLALSHAPSWISITAI